MKRLPKAPPPVAPDPAGVVRLSTGAALVVFAGGVGVRIESNRGFALTLTSDEARALGRELADAADLSAIERGA